MPRSTRKPRMPSSARAHTTATSATEPLVIQVFSPLRIQSAAVAPARVVSMPAGIRSEPRFGQPETADRGAGLQSRQPLLLLFLAAEGEDGIHHQRALHADEAAQAGIAALQLLHDQAVLDVVHAGAAVAFEIGAEKAQLAISGINSEGKRASRKQSRMTGRIRSSTNRRAVWRTSNSCSLNSESTAK